MRIEELKAEKEKINKISENFISNLLEIIEENLTDSAGTMTSFKMIVSQK